MITFSPLQTKFDKHYEHDEDVKRFELFKLKMVEFKAYNEKCKKGETTWLDSVNQFTDLTAKDFCKELKKATTTGH